MRADTRSPGAARPEPGTLWVWEPHSLAAVALVRVTQTRWNGEQWTVATEAIAVGPEEVTGLKPGREYWNELDQFWEACHRVAQRPGLVGDPKGIRRGPLRPDEVQPPDNV